MVHVSQVAFGLCRIFAGAVFPLLFAACAAAGGADGTRDRSPAAVVGKVWEWEAFVSPAEQIVVPAPERYPLELTPDGKVRVRFDCNRGGGSYQIADGKLSFGPLMSTRMACPPGSLGDRYGRELGRVAAFFLESGKLYLELPGDSDTLRFRPAATPPARGK